MTRYKIKFYFDNFSTDPLDTIILETETKKHADFYARVICEARDIIYTLEEVN